MLSSGRTSSFHASNADISSHDSSAAPTVAFIVFVATTVSIVQKAQAEPISRKWLNLIRLLISQKTLRGFVLLDPSQKTKESCSRNSIQSNKKCSNYLNMFKIVIPMNLPLRLRAPVRFESFCPGLEIRPFQTSFPLVLYAENYFDNHLWKMSHSCSTICAFSTVFFFPMSSIYDNQCKISMN